MKYIIILTERVGLITEVPLKNVILHILGIKVNLLNLDTYLMLQIILLVGS